MPFKKGHTHSRKWYESVVGNTWSLGKKFSMERRKKHSDMAKIHGFGKWMKGKKLSIETRMKQGLKKENHPSWNGGLPNCEVCGKKLSNYKSRRCVKCAGILRVGEKNPSWKGGSTPLNAKLRNSNEDQAWRESVFFRDTWTCKECGRKGGKLHAHHIKSFSKHPEVRFSTDNGITLCFPCHKRHHKNMNLKIPSLVIVEIV